MSSFSNQRYVLHVRTAQVRVAAVASWRITVSEAPYSPLAVDLDTPPRFGRDALDLATRIHRRVATGFRDRLGSDWRFSRPDREWSAEELLALVIRYALSGEIWMVGEDGLPDLGGEEIAVIRPISFDDRQVAGLIEAVERTGATVVEAIPEETAIASDVWDRRKIERFAVFAIDEDSASLALVRGSGPTLETISRHKVENAVREGQIDFAAFLAAFDDAVTKLEPAERDGGWTVAISGGQSLPAEATETFLARGFASVSVRSVDAALLGAANMLRESLGSAPSMALPSVAPPDSPSDLPKSERPASVSVPGGSLPAGSAESSGSTPAPSQVFDDDVEFTVFRPRVVRPAVWHPLLAFAHKSENPPDAPDDAPDPIEEVQRTARALLGDAIDDYKQSASESRLAVPREGELTFALDLPGFDLNPPRQSFLWLEPVHRTEFRIRARPESDGTTAAGALSVFLGSILLAEVTLKIRVDGYATPSKREAPERTSATGFKKIFASYSHDDLSIVEQFERYFRAVGDEYLRDWRNLRSGEEWNPRLMEMIREADVFQLFWSTRSMRSRFVRQEWEYALSLGRPRFVRPCYWEDPLPRSPDLGLPPEDLSAIHFHRLEVAEPSSPSDPPPAASAEIPRWDFNRTFPTTARLPDFGEPAPRAAPASVGKKLFKWVAFAVVFAIAYFLGRETVTAILKQAQQMIYGVPSESPRDVTPTP